jgi:hypothetical protein
VLEKLGNKWDNLKVIIGEQIENPPLVLKCSIKFTDGKAPDVFSNGEKLFISNKIKIIFDELGVNGIETIRLEIVNNLYEKQYFLLNVLNKCDCIDFNKSQIVLFGDEVLSIQKLFINKSEFCKQPVFIADRSLVTLIFFQGEIARRLQSSDLLGFELIEPEEFWM